MLRGPREERKIAESHFKGLVNNLAAFLRTKDYLRDRLTFRKIANNNCAIIQIQRSRTNHGPCLSFTVNIGIAYGDLLPADLSIGGATILRADLTHRLGFLIEQRDKWWEIGSDTSMIDIQNEVKSALDAKALPYLEKYLNLHEAVALWEMGQSPGLTDVQRKQRLNLLYGRP